MSESLHAKKKWELIEKRLYELEAAVNISQKSIMKIKKTIENEMQSNSFSRTSFSDKLFVEEKGLSRSEARIAKLVKAGKSSKEISKNLDISEKTVETHRRNIRKKLGIKNKKIDLRSYLLS